MRRYRVAADEWQYRERSSPEVRGTLLRLVREFVISARQVPGITRIALFGSLVSAKARPKDADLLVSIAPTMDLARLARLTRRLQGKAQGINSGADVFLATPEGEYLGRICRYRECYARRICQARHCGLRPHLNDDLDVITLPQTVLRNPPLVVHPGINAASTVPDDVGELLLVPLGTTTVQAEPISRSNSSRAL